MRNGHVTAAATAAKRVTVACETATPHNAATHAPRMWAARASAAVNAMATWRLPTWQQRAYMYVLLADVLST